jgi:hypothetical protein
MAARHLPLFALVAVLWGIPCLLISIAGARLLRPENAGYGVDRPDWAAMSSGILEHTASADRASGR